MELVYSIDFHAFSKASEFVFDEKICCTLSCRNIIAFSRARRAENERDKLDISYEVCVVDLDKPWQEYRVMMSHTAVTYMRWDPAGTTLLIVNAEGCFSLWRMKDHLLNVWEEVGSVEMDKEEILVLAWLHNGIQTLFNPEARDLIVYNEKFSLAKMYPSVTQFGKKPVDGWIAVTSTGMLLVGLIPDHSGPLVMGKASLSQIPMHITQADVAFMPDGQILIAASDGQLNSSVHCYIAALALKNHACLVRCSPSASFFLKKQPDPAIQEQHTPRLTRLSFMNRESSEVLLACWGTANYSCVEVWHLIEQTVPLNRRFQNAAVTEYAFKTKRWIHKSSFVHRSGLTNIARPKMPISRSFNMESTNFLCYFACTYRDGSIKIVHRQSYQVIYTFSLDQLINFKTEPPEKRSRTAVPHLVSAVQTNTGCGLVGLGEGRLYLFRMFNSREGSLQMLPVFVVLLLEYTMYTGLDSWDVLLAVRQGMIEGIVDKLHSNFQKQTGAFQELLQQRLLRLKMALYSCQVPNTQRASDCRAMTTLHAIAAVLKSCLRPKNITAQDKSPAEKLSNLCSLSMEMELDQMTKALEPDDLMRDTFRTTSGSQSTQSSLQSLQPFVQWVTDFVLHILAAVSMYPNYSSYPGATLLKDPQVLCLVRELLIIIRAWGKVSSACLPVFMTTVTLDPLPHLFRLITKAWLMARDNSNIESDQTFVDECCNLPSKMLLPNYRKTFGEEMNCYLAFSQPFPINYEFGVEPGFLFNSRFPHRMFPLDLCLDAEQKYDCVRHMQLGVHPREQVRECVRCRSLSLRRNPAKTKSPLLRAWELRFVKSCLCGGHWKLQTSAKSIEK
ncbi:mediator of RNA polymerase II transcription subunit 16 [Aplysia californica]|uniref:Mediator of RNA polymerase II transcription subunit 16 n=1 Tax=Aplysia californica TaxID=6500 RepID=A0ABM0K0Q5_APLCA|nr:mediator of RNA polymerase II transcription subunit 16 [Aplysia californica]